MKLDITYCKMKYALLQHNGHTYIESVDPYRHSFYPIYKYSQKKPNKSRGMCNVYITPSLLTTDRAIVFLPRALITHPSISPNHELTPGPGGRGFIDYLS